MLEQQTRNTTKNTPDRSEINPKTFFLAENNP